MTKWIGQLALMVAVALPASAATGVDPAVRAMCGKSVALVGESPVHGFGKTLEYKVELVQRLVDECHFNAVFFESGMYDFLKIEEEVKAGHDVTDAAIASAIGGLWANREVGRLIPFLREKAASGKLYLGGLDDQLSRGTWAQREMAAALAASLPGDEKVKCQAILEKHTLWQYTSAAPYAPEDKARILGCLGTIAARLRATNAPDREDRLTMVESLKRFIGRDFETVPAGMDEDTQSWNERDRSMYLNFRWLLSQLPARSKVIVWMATVHAAKELSSVKELEKKVPFGSYVHQDFGDRAFALGFSAYSGSYAFAGRPAQELSAAPGDSLEARSLASRDADTVYLPRSELRKDGLVAARPLGTSFMTARWDEVVDGLVIIRRERPPEYLRH